MTGVFIVDSNYILYQSSTANEYLSSICNDYSNDVFKTGKVYSFSNTSTFSWTYGSSTSDVSASKIISLEATTPPTNGQFELLRLFNVSCVNWETSDRNSDLQYSSYFLKSSYDEYHLLIQLPVLQHVMTHRLMIFAMIHLKKQMIMMEMSY